MYREGARELIVMVVDDHQGVARGWARELTALGCRCLVAYTAAEALRVLEDAPHLSAAVVDFRLPDGDGLQVVKAIRARWPLAAIALVTGDPPYSGFANDVMQRGVFYGRKPLSARVFAGLLERAVRLALATGKSPSIDDLLAPHGLSPAERVALAAQLAAKSHQEAVRISNKDTHTLKSQTSAALHKCGHSTLRAFTSELLRTLGVRGLQHKRRGGVGKTE